jgi:hypothetical protein
LVSTLATDAAAIAARSVWLDPLKALPAVSLPTRMLVRGLLK